MTNYKTKFIKMNSELYELLHSGEGLNYFSVIESMGGKKVADDIRKIYEKNKNNKTEYANGVLEYFKNNTDKHEEWIARLKFKLL